MARRDLDTPAVDLREDDGVWWITFNRPEASNAFTLADLDRLSEIFQEAGDRPRAAVLTGAGRRSFSAGMHLAAFADLSPQRARVHRPEQKRSAGCPDGALPDHRGHQRPLPRHRSRSGPGFRHSHRRAARHLRASRDQGGRALCLRYRPPPAAHRPRESERGDPHRRQLHGRRAWPLWIPERRGPTRRALGRDRAHAGQGGTAHPGGNGRPEEAFRGLAEHDLSAGIDMSVEVFSSVFAATETYEQIERYRRAIGGRPPPE